MMTCPLQCCNIRRNIHVWIERQIYQKYFVVCQSYQDHNMFSLVLVLYSGILDLKLTFEDFQL